MPRTRCRRRDAMDCRSAAEKTAITAHTERALGRMTLLVLYRSRGPRTLGKTQSSRPARTDLRDAHVSRVVSYVSCGLRYEANSLADARDTPWRSRPAAMSARRGNSHSDSEFSCLEVRLGKRAVLAYFLERFAVFFNIPTMCGRTQVRPRQQDLVPRCCRTSSRFSTCPRTGTRVSNLTAQATRTRSAHPCAGTRPHEYTHAHNPPSLHAALDV